MQIYSLFVQIFSYFLIYFKKYIKKPFKKILIYFVSRSSLDQGDFILSLLNLYSGFSRVLRPRRSSPSTLKKGRGPETVNPISPRGAILHPSDIKRRFMPKKMHRKHFIKFLTFQDMNLAI